MENIDGLTRSAITVPIPAHNEAQDIGTTIESVQSQSRPKTVNIAVFVPAHDEELTIAATVEAIHAQGLPASSVTVICDNCTDRTAIVAAEHGADIFTTYGNTGKKAGALNQALNHFLPVLHETDVVLVMDADSRISPDFLKIACAALADPSVGAVGGIFYGQRTGRRLIELFQISEYIRYARQIARNGSRAYVLTGTATAFTVKMLREVSAGRTDGRLPPGPGSYYDEKTMTEDSYMTFAVKTLGYRTPSPAQCWVSTEVMPTWKTLWMQRRRWQMGALENLKAFGPWNRVTWSYSARQVVSIFELLFFLAYAYTSIWSGATGTYRVIPFWIAIGSIFWLERVISVRKAGWPAMLLSATMIAELGYGLFMKAVNLYSYCTVIRNRNISWS
jgi:poly-beta-1,6-N-acetyl-D-glucosamine synthase